MEIVLLQRIEKLGQMGDVVSVKDGYARNFLLPQGKALRATKPNLARFETERAQLETHNLEQRGEAAYRITLAVAGFREEDLAITIEDRQLVIRGRQADEAEDERVFLHRGIAARAFEKRFQLRHCNSTNQDERPTTASSNHRGNIPGCDCPI